MTWRALVFVVGAIVAATSCAPVDRKTQITIAIASETEVPTELDTYKLRVISTRNGEVRLDNDYFPRTGKELPVTLAVIPADESALTSPIRVVVEGRKAGELLIERQSIVSYVEGRNVLLPLTLRMACFQSTSCGPNATCVGGECREATTDGAKLLDFQEGYVFGKSGSCFDEQACLADAQPVEVDEDCTFALDAPEGRGNVAIRWAAAPSRLLALESENPLEGWTRLPGGRAKLSQGACDSHFARRDATGKLLVADRAETVYVAAACAAKTSNVPHCFSDVTKHAGIGAVIP